MEDLRTKLISLLRQVTGIEDLKNLNKHEEVIEKATGLDSKTLYRLFKKDITKQEIIKDSDLKKIYKALSSFRSKDKTSRVSFSEREFIDRFFWEPTIFNTPNLHIISLPHSEVQSHFARELYEKRYISLMAKVIYGAQRCMLVADFLGKGDNEIGETQTVYGEVHEILFEEIEKKLGVNRLKSLKEYSTSRGTYKLPVKPKTSPDELEKYLRVFYLPHADSQIIENGDFKVRNKRYAIIDGALLCMSRAAFKHLCTCINSTTTKASFYASTIIRPYHFGIVEGRNDDEILVLSEYYVYRKKTRNGQIRFIAEADLVFVEHTKLKNYSKEVKESYRDNFLKAEDQGVRIKKEDIEHFVKKSKEIKQTYLKNMGYNDSEKFNHLVNLKIEIFNEVFDKNYPSVPLT